MFLKMKMKNFKEMRTQTKIMMIGLSLLAITACTKKDNALKGKVALKINSLNSSFQLSSTNTPAIKGVNASKISWNLGFLNLSGIEVNNKNESEKSSKEGNENLNEKNTEDSVKKIDLFVPNQSLGIVDIAIGSYDSLLVKIDISQTVSLPALYLKGNYTNASGVNKIVEFSLNEGVINTQTNNQQNGDFQGGQNDDLKILATLKNLIISAQSNSVASINLDYMKLLLGVTDPDFDQATLTNGAIIINKTNNVIIYNKIKGNINKFSQKD